VAASGSDSLTQTVNPASLQQSTTTLISSANPSTLGAPVTFTAVVTAPGFAGTPTGTVTFTIDGNAQAPLSLAVVGSRGEAQFVTSALAAGQHSVTVSYSGDANVGPSSGSLPTQFVNAPGVQATTTHVTSSLNPSTVGQPVTFTAVVTAPGFSESPTGTVIFTIDGQAQTPVQVSVAGGLHQAQFVTSTLGIGQHSVTATYSGDSALASSTVASALIQNVGPRATAIAAVSSADPSNVGQPVTFTATVTPSAGASVVSGSVTFAIDGKVQAPVPLKITSAGEQAAIEISGLSAGEHVVTAIYSGDATDSATSLARPLIQAVNESLASPPEVTGVQRFGFHMHPTILVLTFNTGLDPISATNLKNYVLTDPAGRSIGIKWASYDPFSHTVTLLPRARVNLHRTYRLRVKGANPNGIASTKHTLLDGTGNGKSGTDFVTNLDSSSAVLPPALAQNLQKQIERNQRRR
jgi:hypothetical protein